jgi:hypothetical protein
MTARLDDLDEPDSPAYTTGRAAEAWAPGRRSCAPRSCYRSGPGPPGRAAAMTITVPSRGQPYITCAPVWRMMKSQSRLVR